MRVDAAMHPRVPSTAELLPTPPTLPRHGGWVLLGLPEWLPQHAIVPRRALNTTGSCWACDAGCNSARSPLIAPPRRLDFDGLAALVLSLTQKARNSLPGRGLMPNSSLRDCRCLFGTATSFASHDAPSLQAYTVPSETNFHGTGRSDAYNALDKSSDRRLAVC